MKYKTKIKLVRLKQKIKKLQHIVFLNILFILNILAWYFIYLFIQKCYETNKNIFIP